MSGAAQNAMTRAAVEVIDRPPPGWFILDVVKAKSRGHEWVALMIDVDPDDFVNKRKTTASPSKWVRIPGKHRTRDDAWDVLEAMMATRH